jgi:hypothetical protein
MELRKKLIDFVEVYTYTHPSAGATFLFPHYPDP